ncbi:polyamine aminopropyltransferase [Planctellipticum variicoloris]|uniref:polyamine aminopropyltransferase n=1 Tax=Planctellipticum variicoloris TaxID=3064265 RepID=UPI002C13E65F|nr:polyamine aminopropyltransferase [Planctomycetaceae bacterium SH412]HTN00617.1 polyamine aminopropyltransferase [Planctomycetaceae bacterium]
MPGALLAADLWISEYLTPCDVWQHGVTRLLAHRQTSFQEMSIVESGPYGKALVLDGKWQTCTGDEFLYHEPIVHVPCSLHGAPKTVLIAGGADGGALREALKWKSVERVVVADIDGEVIQACRELLPEIHQGAFDDPRAEIAVGDAWDYVASTPNTWDVIIADLTDPIEEGPAFKLFTREFFALCRNALRPGGLFVNQAGSMSPPLSHLLSRVVKTIGSVFPQTSLISANVPTYGSQWGLALASDRLLNTRPDPAVIDELLATSLQGQPLRMFDGQTLLGLLQWPKYLRDAVAAETCIYTVDAPPKFFGQSLGTGKS